MENECDSAVFINTTKPLFVSKKRKTMQIGASHEKHEEILLKKVIINQNILNVLFQVFDKPVKIHLMSMVF